MKHNKKVSVLLINPPVYDFAAYDLWAKPLGLLYLSSILKKQNINVVMFDYMDRNYQSLPRSESNQYGCGHYLKEEIQKPDIINNIKRKYYRFGVPKYIAEQFFKQIKEPDIIIIGSIMTYWYLGIEEVANVLKQAFPKTTIILGGIYATLCKEHAQRIKNIDEVVVGTLNNLNVIFKKYNLDIIIKDNFENMPMPDYSNYNNLGYIALRTSMGCPFRCSYCAQHILNNAIYNIKSPYTIKEEICKLANNSIKNISFYDDALLFNADIGIKVLLKELINSNIMYNIHTPNGLHAKFLDQELADLMFYSKFIQPRFSLETSNSKEQIFSDNKINNKKFINAIKSLNNAGYKEGEYTTYLLIGLPEQNIDSIKESILFVHNLGSKISLSEYSLIPYTKNWYEIEEKYKSDPLIQNNTYFVSTHKDYDKLIKIKQLAKELNNKL